MILRTNKNFNFFFLSLRYASALTDFFYWRFFLQPFASTLTIALSIFLQHTGNWSSGYGYSACVYIQLLVLCYMGDLIKIQVRNNEEISLH